MRIACYARTSADLHTDSIENQFSIMENYILSKSDLQGAEIMHFADNGESGITTERLAFQELLVKVRQRSVDCIIVKDFSRLGRNYLDVCKLTESIFPFMGVRLIAVTEGYDSLNKDKSTVDLSTAFKSVMNEFYVIETSEKVKKSCRMRIQKGEFIGHVPYGYQRENKTTVVIHEEQAAVICEIYALFLSGNDLKEIAKELNQRGVPTCCGTKWTNGKVRLILKNESYTGKRVSFKNTRNVKTKKKVANPDQDWYVNEHGYPQIISQKDFEKAQELLPKGVSRVVQDKHIMARKLVCAKCGRTLYRYDYDFGCKLPYLTGENPCFKGTLKKKDLYPVVLEKVKAVIRTELETYKRQFSFSEIEKLDREINALKEKKAALFERLLTNKMSQEEFTEQNVIISNEIAEKEQFANEKRRCYALTSRLGLSERPVDTLKRLLDSNELTKEHMQFVKRIIVTDPDHYEIEIYEESPLAVLCRNVDLFDEE